MKRSFFTPLATPLIIASLLAGCTHTPVAPPVMEIAQFKEQIPEVSRAIAEVRGRRRPDFRGKYDGPQPPFRRDQWERRPTNTNFCQKYINETAKHALACAAGAEDGAKMAVSIAGNHGREDGYMRGFAWGLNQSAYFYQNSPEEMRRGEGNVGILDNEMYRATDEGRTAGSTDGASLGTSEAKSKFYRAVDTKVMPSLDYKLPPTNFSPTQNAYARFIAPIPTVNDILKRDRFGRMKFYDSYDRVYGGGSDWRERNSRDLWSNDGVYNHNQDEWVNGPKMFEYYIQRIPGAQRRYNDLKSLTLNNSSAETLTRLPADENNRPARPPGQGGQGGQGQGRPGGTPPQPPVVQPPVAEVPVVAPVNPTAVEPVKPYVDYQAIFKEAFIAAYNTYAQDAYSREYWRSIDNGQEDGEDLGLEIGTEIAYYKGMSLAFNRNYIAKSEDAYDLNFAKTFGDAHLQTYNYYKNNAILSLNFQNVVGLEDDGVIQPGEELSAKFKVTNYGGVSSPLEYTLQGDVQDAKKLTDSINPISSKVITSPRIGDVLNTLDNGSDARYVLVVNGLQENLMQQIKRPIQLQNVKSNLSEIDGTGIFSLTITNIATVALNGTISLELLIDGVVRKTIIAEAMKPGEVRNYSLDFQNQDPITWIEKGHKSEILVKYNNVVFAKSAQTMMVADQMVSLASYYVKLINEKGFVPAGKSPESRLEEVRNKIVSANSAEVDRIKEGTGNTYRTDPSATIPGKILNAKNAFKDIGPKSSGELTTLTDLFNKDSKKLKALFGMTGPKKSAYEFLLTSISGKKY